MNPRGKRCAVEDCGTTATADLPIGNDIELDLGVCRYHHDRIAREPDRWQIVSVPVVGTTKERTVVTEVRVDDPS